MYVANIAINKIGMVLPLVGEATHIEMRRGPRIESWGTQYLKSAKNTERQHECAYGGKQIVPQR